MNKTTEKEGSGRGSVGRAVASDTRGSSPVSGKNFIENLFSFNCTEKTKINKNKERRGRCHF